MAASLPFLDIFDHLTQAEEVLRVWLGTPFGGGRHAARVAKITQIERKYAKEPS